MIGTVEAVKNQDKQDAAASEYLRIVVYDNGAYSNLLLTAADLLRVRERAMKNPEDCATPSWWHRFLHWFMR